MANGAEDNVYCLWDKNISSRKSAKRTQEDEVVVVVVEDKKQSPRIHSASAQDLSCCDMEKEKQNVSSPRGVLEVQLRDLESETPSPEDNMKESESCRGRPKALFHWRKFFKLWSKKYVKRPTSFPLVGVSRILKVKSRNEGENPIFSDIKNIKPSMINFKFTELQTATNNFCDENLIGKGGYAEVYKACLKDGQLVAVKRLTKGTMDDKAARFLSELGIIAHIDHPKVAKLIGCCIEGGMHLVFQLSSLGSLGSLLHGSKDNNLDWSKRYKIALGTADGLLYLHENCHRRIIHRDIKAENILLTKDYEPQICDFGLAKWLPRQWTHHNLSKFEGTFGYFAPEYFMHGIVDEKTDVYSFGVLLLELITGRRALDDLQQSLVVWAKPLINTNNTKEIIDPSLGDNYDSEKMDRIILTASLCTEQSPILRPQMSQVIILLRGDEYISEYQNEGQERYHRTYSEELLDAREYNSTRMCQGMMSWLYGIVALTLIMIMLAYHIGRRLAFGHTHVLLVNLRLRE